jgi:hypothetical protein
VVEQSRVAVAILERWRCISSKVFVTAFGGGFPPCVQRVGRAVTGLRGPVPDCPRAAQSLCMTVPLYANHIFYQLIKKLFHESIFAKPLFEKEVG